MSKRTQLIALCAVLILEAYLLRIELHLKLPHYTLPIVSGVYFSLGDAVAALALVFAVIQLANDSWGLTVRIKGRLKGNLVWILLVVGLSVTLVSALLPQPSSTDISVYKNPLFWQAVAFLSFAAAPFVLRHIGTHRKHLFTRSSAERYYQVLLAAFSTGDSKQIKAATDIILESLDSVVEVIKPKPFRAPLFNKLLWKISRLPLGKKVAKWHQQRWYKRQKAKDENENKTITPSQYVYKLFDTALTDKAVSSYLATKRIDFVWNFTHAIIKHRLAGRPLRRGFNSIVAELLSNENSYLFRQSKYTGTGQFAPLNDLIFGSKYLAEAFEPIREWEQGRYGTVPNPEQSIEVFLLALETSIKNDAFNNTEIGHSIGFIMYRLSEYTRTLLYSSEDALNEHHMAFWRIEQFFSSTFLELYSQALKDNKVSEVEKSVPKGKKYQQQSLAATYAECFVEFLGELGRSQKDGMSMHSLVVFALNNLYEKEEYSNIRNVFEQYAWEAIDNSIDTGFYPPFVKIYIRLIYFTNKSENAWIKTEREKLMSMVNGKLKAKIKARTKMNNDRDYMEDYLLPSNLKYNRKKNKFEWTDTGNYTSDFE